MEGRAEALAQLAVNAAAQCLGVSQSIPKEEWEPGMVCKRVGGTGGRTPAIAHSLFGLLVDLLVFFSCYRDSLEEKEAGKGKRRELGS